VGGRVCLEAGMILTQGHIAQVVKAVLNVPYERNIRSSWRGEVCLAARLVTP